MLFTFFLVTFVVIFASVLPALADSDSSASIIMTLKSSPQKSKTVLKRRAGLKTKSVGDSSGPNIPLSPFILGHILAVANATSSANHSSVALTESSQLLKLAGITILKQPPVLSKKDKKLAQALAFNRVELRVYGDYPARDGPAVCNIRPFLVDSYILNTPIPSYFDGQYNLILQFLGSQQLGQADFHLFLNGYVNLDIYFTVPFLFDQSVAAEEPPLPSCNEYGLEQNYVVKAVLKNDILQPKTNEMGLCSFFNIEDCLAYSYDGSSGLDPVYCRTIPLQQHLAGDLTKLIIGDVRETWRNEHWEIESGSCSNLAADGNSGTVDFSMMDGDNSRNYQLTSCTNFAYAGTYYAYNYGTVIQNSAKWFGSLDPRISGFTKLTCK
jgi:hypothetical protein